MALELLGGEGPDALKNLFPLGRMVDAVYSLEEIEMAFERAGQRASLGRWPRSWAKGERMRNFRRQWQRGRTSGCVGLLRVCLFQRLQFVPH